MVLHSAYSVATPSAVRTGPAVLGEEPDGDRFWLTAKGEAFLAALERGRSDAEDLAAVYDVEEAT